MTAQIVDCFFSPDTDNAWSRSPGALASVNALAPLQNGSYGSTGTADFFGVSITGSDNLMGKLFPQVSGAVRFLTFRAGNIDEYDPSGTRTNRGTAYTADRWSAAQWGDQIIACDYADATQTSTGGAFTALTGDITPPKARFVASNLNFTCLGAVNDGGSNVFDDMVWWCGIRNTGAWDPAQGLSTQCGNYRLLEAPGPLTGLVPFRDGFCAFKSNAMWFARWIGPPLVFDWQVVSTKIGSIARDAIVELDGKLYFIHSSGIYEYDGQSLTNVGRPIFHSLRSEGGYAVIPGWGNSFTVSNTTAEGLDSAQAAVDDIEGVVWFRTSYQVSATHAQTMVLYGYNARAQKWGRHVVAAGTGIKAFPRLVTADYNTMQNFKSDQTGRLWTIFNDATTRVRSVRYPYGGTDNANPFYRTGVFGSVDGSDYFTKHYVRTLYGTEAGALATGNCYTFVSEDQVLPSATINCNVNSEFNDIDGFACDRFKALDVTFSNGKIVLLGGVGFNGAPGGKR